MHHNAVCREIEIKKEEGITIRRKFPIINVMNII
jgi:hypothetical protein